MLGRAGVKSNKKKGGRRGGGGGIFLVVKGTGRDTVILHETCHIFAVERKLLVLVRDFHFMYCTWREVSSSAARLAYHSGQAEYAAIMKHTKHRR